MANILDYVEWRGDLTFAQAAFCEVDALILAQLAYMPYDGIVSEDFFDHITLREAAEALEKKNLPPTEFTTIKDKDLLQLCGQSARFGQLKLCGYWNHLDQEAAKQFAAVTFELDPSKICVAFRGTDDTLAGWKEDFRMLYMTIPAQLESVEYLEKAGQMGAQKINVSGHSKGGNLAIFASAGVSGEIQSRLSEIYSFDGPGFSSEFLEGSGYQVILNKIRSYVPQSSVVGLMLENNEERTIVSSTEMGGISQHVPYTWQLKGTRFKREENITAYGKFIDKTLKSWVEKMDAEQKENFFDILFENLEKAQVSRFSELSESWHLNTMTIVKSFFGMEKAKGKVVSSTLGALAASARENISSILPVREEKPSKEAQSAAEENDALPGQGETPADE